MSDAEQDTENKADDSNAAEAPKQKIKIGSQRPGHENVGRVIQEKRAKPTIDGTGATSWEAPAGSVAPAAPAPAAATSAPAAETAPTAPADEKPASPPAAASPPKPKPAKPVATPHLAPIPASGSPNTVSSGAADPTASADTTDGVAEMEQVMDGDSKSYPKPRVSHLSVELQQEIDSALQGVSMDGDLDAMLLGDAGTTRGKEPAIGSRVRATVVKLHREDVLFSLPGNYEGISALKHFEENPEIGSQIEVSVNRLNLDDGLYEVSLPGAAESVEDWSDLETGMTVSAKVTGHNTGGLECEVSGISAFMPISQISLYRVEDIEQFVGETWPCVVNEANPARGNLVISRRALLEREKEGQREQLMQAIEVGQEREGIVRSLRDFGAFVDIGGVDGLIHISKLSWDRIKHPSEVLEEGQKVKVVIDKIEDGKIGLTYRDAVDHPWKKAASEFLPNSIVTGTVSKIMDFGAFVRLTAGVEGLIHISELAHHRVVRVANVVSEGQEVSVKILSVDPENQRMSLSIKAVQAPPAKKSDGKKKEEEIDEPPRPSAVKKFEGDLKGGTNKKTGGEQFGLNW